MTLRPLEYYLERYLEGSITSEEWKSFQSLINDPDNDAILDRIMDLQLTSRFASKENYPYVIGLLKKELIQGRFHEDETHQAPQPLTADIQSAENLHEDIKPVYREHFLKTAWFKYAAAILLILTGSFLYYRYYRLSHSPQPGNEVVQTTPLSVPEDVSPGYNRAVLTLSNGQQIELASAASETIKDGTISITNNSGHLIYKNADVGAMNTMSTPRGGQYRLTLPDGTNVWLNAASSITYPTAFTGKTREVKITGEAYFEVTKNTAKPFIIETDKDKIEVLGTQFNVNAYKDENGTKTSLLEGSVRIGEKILKPGQAYINGKVVTTNLEQDIAWKNGVFNFHHVKLPHAMRQIARWYDIDISYEGDVENIELGGRIGRNLTIQQLIRGLEQPYLKFELKDKILTIKNQEP